LDEALAELRRAHAIDAQQVEAWGAHDADLEPLRGMGGYPLPGAS
jgi:hypothetical protein